MPSGIIHLATVGRSFHNEVGWIDIKPSNLKEAVNWFNAKPEKERRYVVKYGSHKIDADAAGWMTGMVGVPSDAPNDVFAVVEWNQFAADAIKEKKQRYISPEIYPKWGDKNTSERVYAIRGAALTNDPHLTELSPAMVIDSVSLAALDMAEYFTQSIPLDSVTDSRVALASDGVIPMEVREKMCTMLGLDASASDDEMIAKIGDLQKAKADGETEIEVKLSAVAAKDAEVVALTAAVAEKDKTLGELQIQLTAANTAAATAASEKLDIEAAQAVEALITQGKALPRERALLLSAYKKDPTDAKAQWAVRGKVIELSAPTGITDPAGLGGIELAVATQKKMEADGASPQEAAIAAMKLTQG